MQEWQEWWIHKSRMVFKIRVSHIHFTSENFSHPYWVHCTSHARSVCRSREVGRRVDPLKLRFRDCFSPKQVFFSHRTHPRTRRPTCLCLWIVYLSLLSMHENLFPRVKISAASLPICIASPSSARSTKVSLLLCSISWPTYSIIFLNTFIFHVPSWYAIGHIKKVYALVLCPWHIVCETVITYI